MTVKEIGEQLKAEFQEQLAKTEEIKAKLEARIALCDELIAHEEAAPSEGGSSAELEALKLEIESKKEELRLEQLAHADLKAKVREIQGRDEALDKELESLVAEPVQPEPSPEVEG